MKDYYSILGVQRTASEAEVRRAYRRLAVLYHPDKNKDPGAHEIFVEVTEAYDVISDSARRYAYDQIIDHPHSGIPVVEERKRTHRDPAYRRRNAGYRPPPAQPETYSLMKQYLKYFQWAGRIGLVASVLFFIDYVLPYKITEEKIAEIYEVRGRKNSTSHNVVITESGKKIKLYDGQAGPFFREPTIAGGYTLLYSTPMWVSNSAGTYRVRLAYMYRGLLLFPVILLVTSFLGILYKNHVEFCFNVNLVSGVILVIFLILI